MKKEDKKSILDNIKWFSKFSLLERLKIALIHKESIQKLRGLKIEGLKKPA